MTRPESEGWWGVVLAVVNPRGVFGDGVLDAYRDMLGGM